MQKQKAEVGKVYRTALVTELRAIDESKRTIDFVASTEATDRYGDIIRTAGWKLDAYRKNPVFLWAHKSGEPPIGKCVDCHVESNPPALVQTIQFATKEVYPFADVIFNLYRGKFLSAVSVGFLPLEMPNRVTDAEGNATGGWEFTSQELLELSAVPVPANPEAIARAVTKGFAEGDLARVFCGPSAEAVYRELAEINHEIARIAVSLAKATLLKAAELRTLLERKGLLADEEELQVEEMLAAIRQAGSSVQEAPVLEIGDEITTLDELAAAVGTSDEPPSPDETFSDSRKWRTGRFSMTRELR